MTGGADVSGRVDTAGGDEMTRNFGGQNARIVVVLSLIAVLLLGVAMLTANLRSVGTDSAPRATSGAHPGGGLGRSATML
jgi:hypothetical protein